MNNSTQILDKINAALAAMPYPDQPVGLYEPIKYVLSLGGKRLRPVLLLLAYQLYRDDLDCAMPAALGLETYHNYTLLHDDLMDRADIRRGRPTVHRVWDENTAILSGDTMLVLAYRLMQACENADVLRLFTKTALEIGEGQQYDMNFERRTDVTEPEYIEMIRLKTSVLLACAAKAGAILGGASDEDADLLYAYAEQVGLAFQLQDDWLDVYGDPAVFGKKIVEVREDRLTDVALQRILLSVICRRIADGQPFCLGYFIHDRHGLFTPRASHIAQIDDCALAFLEQREHFLHRLLIKYVLIILQHLISAHICALSALLHQILASVSRRSRAAGAQHDAQHRNQ